MQNSTLKKSLRVAGLLKLDHYRSLVGPLLVPLKERRLLSASLS